MDPLTMGLVMAGVGAAKSAAIDAPRAQADVTRNAAAIRYSPWTGMKPGKIHDFNPGGSALQGFGAGLTMGKTPTSGASPNFPGLPAGTTSQVPAGLAVPRPNDLSAPALDTVPTSGPSGDFGTGAPSGGGMAAPGAWGKMIGQVNGEQQDPFTRGIGAWSAMRGWGGR